MNFFGLNKTSTGDGIVAALQIMAILINQSKSLSELKSGMKKYPQILNNIKVLSKLGKSAYSLFRWKEREQ